MPLYIVRVCLARSGTLTRPSGRVRYCFGPQPPAADFACGPTQMPERARQTLTDIWQLVEIGFWLKEAYLTVTLLAKFLGISGSFLRRTARW